MRFGEKGYYIEEYVKCANCGVLIYGEALQGQLGNRPAVFCTAWCRDWPSLRETWTESSDAPQP